MPLLNLETYWKDGYPGDNNSRTWIKKKKASTKQKERKNNTGISFVGVP